MSNTPTDAEKLAAVCAIIYGGTWVDEWGQACEEEFLGPRRFRVIKDRKFSPNSLDDLARILRELTPGQRFRYECEIGDAFVKADGPAELFAYWIATAPLPVLLDALYRAVVKQ